MLQTETFAIMGEGGGWCSGAVLAALPHAMGMWRLDNLILPFSRAAADVCITSLCRAPATAPLVEFLHGAEGPRARWPSLFEGFAWGIYDEASVERRCTQDDGGG